MRGRKKEKTIKYRSVEQAHQQAGERPSRGVVAAAGRHVPEECFTLRCQGLEQQADDLLNGYRQIYARLFKGLLFRDLNGRTVPYLAVWTVRGPPSVGLQHNRCSLTARLLQWNSSGQQRKCKALKVTG